MLQTQYLFKIIIIIIIKKFKRKFNKTKGQQLSSFPNNKNVTHPRKENKLYIYILDKEINCICELREIRIP